MFIVRQAAPINLTADTYGKWLPLGNKAAVDRLDATSFGESGSKVVAETGLAPEGESEVIEKLMGRVGVEPTAR
jgi:hypothetical protein